MAARKSSGKGYSLFRIRKVKDATQIGSFFKKVWRDSEIAVPGLAFTLCGQLPCSDDQANLRNMAN